MIFHTSYVGLYILQHGSIMISHTSYVGFYLYILQEFDNGKGHISVKDLRQVMTTLGDRMTDQEVDEMLLEADVKNGLIKISGISSNSFVLLDRMIFYATFNIFQLYHGVFWVCYKPVHPNNRNAFVFLSAKDG